MKLQITYLPVEGLKPYDKNPRKNKKAVEIVKKSIQAFGFKNPIIIDKDNVIIAGHTRLLAAKELNLTEVPVIYAEDLTQEQVNAFRIMDNKSQEYSEWDLDLLKKETEFLKNVGFDMELTGFQEDELNAIFMVSELDKEGNLDSRWKVITVEPPEAPRLKEKCSFYCDKLENYEKIKKFFGGDNKLDVSKLLGLI